MSVLMKKWLEDPWYGEVYLFLETLMVQGNYQEQVRVRRQARKFLVKESGLNYKDLDGNHKKCIQRCDVLPLLQEYHDGTPGGHFGRDLMMAQI